MFLVIVILVVAAIAAVAITAYLLVPRKRSPVRGDPNATASITINVRGGKSSASRPAEYDEDETI